MSEPSGDLARVLRWLDAGASVREVGRVDDRVTVALCSCDGGAELERFTSTDAGLLDYLARTQDGDGANLAEPPA